MSIGELAGLASALSWACTTVTLRSVSARIDPLSLNTMRSVVAALFFVIVVVVANRFGDFAHVTSLAFLALCGSLLCGYVVGDTLFFKSMQLVGVSTALPLSMTYPLYVLAIAWAFLGERVTIVMVIGTFIVIAGAISIASGAQSMAVGQHRDRRLGVALAVLSSLCFAASTSILKIGVQNVDVVVAGTIRLGLTAILLLVWRSTMMKGPPFRAYGRRALLVIAVAAVIGSGVGTITYLTAVQQAGAAIASTLATTAPLFATPLSALFLKERLTRRNVVGMLLCVAGVWLVVLQ
jgi:drug/metabolite transporter (DMT)-like permease